MATDKGPVRRAFVGGHGIRLLFQEYSHGIPGGFHENSQEEFSLTYKQ